jgi:UDP-glucose 4-epimerase
VVRTLLDHGHQVRILVRRAGAPHDPRVEPVIGDVTDVAALGRAVDGIDAVIHLAALLHVVDPDPSLRAVYQAVNVDATIALADAARRAGARRFVLASTTAVYGPTAAAASETTPAAPESWYAESKLAAEATVTTRHHAGQFDVTVLRLSAVYGPRVKGNYQRLLGALAAGRFVPIGSGRHCRSLVYEDDAASALRLAVAHAPAPSGIFNVTDGTPHELRAIIAAMCRALGRPVPRLTLPAGPVRLAAALAATASRLVGRRPPSAVASLAKYLEPSVVDGSRWVRELGFQAHVDLDTGWRRTAEALREAGVLPAARPA